MGKLDLSKENYSEAIQNFNIAAIAKPNDFEAYFLRGIAHAHHARNTTSFVTHGSDLIGNALF